MLRFLPMLRRRAAGLPARCAVSTGRRGLYPYILGVSFTKRRAGGQRGRGSKDKANDKENTYAPLRIKAENLPALK